MKFSGFIENSELSFHSPITQEKWDVALENTENITFKTPSGKEVPFRKVKHGEWKRLGKEKYINLATANEQYKVLGYPHRNIERLRCSECGMLTLVDETIAYDFCPHCGADMRGNAE